MSRSVVSPIFPTAKRSSLRSIRHVKGLRPLCGSHGEPLTAVSLRLRRSQRKWQAIPPTGNHSERGQLRLHLPNRRLTCKRSPRSAAPR